MTPAWAEVKAASPCQICDKPDWCSRSSDGVWSVCRRLETGGGLHKVDQAGVDFWLYWTGAGGRGGQAVPTELPSEPQAARAAPEDLDRVYHQVLDSLTLSSAHREQLQHRGLSDEQIALGEYRTLPERRRAQLARDVAKTFDPALLITVPGFYVKRGGGDEWISFAGRPGLLIPVADASGRIVALKVRTDAGAGQRYRYVSSKQYGGPGPGAVVHVPLGFKDSALRVRLTEGELKADVATALSGVLTISTPGVSAWRAAIKTLGELVGTPPKTVVLAFDADVQQNRHVAQALRMAALGLGDAGYVVELEVWPIDQGKGIDDLLAAGVTPELLTGDDVGRTVSTWAADTAAANPTQGETELDKARELVASLPERTATDPGAAFEPEALAAIALVRAGDSPAWIRVEVRLREVKQFPGIQRLNQELAKQIDGPRQTNGAIAVHQVPVIRVDGRYMRDITGDALRALQTVNEKGPRLFVQGNAPVRLNDSPDDKNVYTEPLTPASLKGMLDRSADFVKTESGNPETPARPPDDVVADILSLDTLPFPDLKAIAKVPVVLSEGRILRAPGYDPESGYFLNLNGLSNTNASMKVDDAVSLLLDETLGEFPFVDQASRAHILALILQPFVMPLIDGPTPLYLLEAPAKGTGKGLLAEVVHLISHGDWIGVMGQPKDEDEMRKSIFAILLKGNTMVCLDNIYRLVSGQLSSVLTTMFYEARILGSSKIIRVRNKATWMATGNNVVISDEMARRVVLSRLDAMMEHPETRTDFRHPHLAKWVRDNRPMLVSAALSIIKAWADVGMPMGTATLGKFEVWAGTMSGILDVAEVPGFLGNREMLVTESDQESQEWVAFCRAWWEKHRGLIVSGKDLLDVAKAADLHLDLWAGRAELKGQQRIAHAVLAKRSRVYGHFRIHSDPEHRMRNNSRAYFLEPMDGVGVKTMQNHADSSEGVYGAGDGRMVLSNETMQDHAPEAKTMHETMQPSDPSIDGSKAPDEGARMVLHGFATDPTATPGEICSADFDPDDPGELPW